MVNAGKDKLKVPYYKVLFKNSNSLTGGYSSFDYKSYLPTPDGKPGKWLVIPANKRLSMCQTGWHVTDNPESWHSDQRNARVFKVEVEGQYLTDGSTKIACRKIRLVEEVHKVNGKWVPEKPKTYTKAEVAKIVTDLKAQYDKLFQTALSQLQ